jgi:phosphohistidine phosphatase
MLKLFLLRHAKSSWQDVTLDDFERPLKENGLKEASFMGGVYNKFCDSMPDAVISSHARRALETAQLFAKEIDYPLKKIILQKNIYGATSEELFEVLRDIGDEYKNVVMVGHNPGFTELANHIIDGVDIDNIPTCGLLGIEFDVKSWKKIEEKSGKLFCFEYPKKYS